jgi:hypothetical protein
LWLSIFLVLYLVPVMAQVQPPTTELYRWYNTGTGDHFYTTDPHGENALTSGYSYEGITGYIGTSPTPGTTALYRWYNGPRPFSANYGDHFYTTDPAGENAQRLGYTLEGITGYIGTSPTPGTTALYRWYNNKIHHHLYTTNPQGENAQDFTYEGITGYIWTTKI